MDHSDNNFRIPINAKVALKTNFESVYFNVTAGMQGHIRKHKQDEDGFSWVYVEWDKNHWRYSRHAKDDWTLEDHFNVIEMPAEDEESVEEETRPENWFERLVEEAKLQAQRTPHFGEPEDDDPYLDSVMQAMDVAAESDAFMVLTVTIDEQGDQNMVKPVVFTQAKSLSSDIVLKMELIRLALMANHDTAEDILRMLNERPEDPEDV